MTRTPAAPIRFTLTPAAHQARQQAAGADHRSQALHRAAAREAKLIEQARAVKESRS
jgi:hypothetical protein